MKHQAPFFAWIVCFMLLFFGVMFVCYSPSFVPYWRQAAVIQAPSEGSILGRRRDRNGKLLTTVELDLMSEVDQKLRKNPDRYSYRVASGRRDVQTIVQMRKTHGVPSPTIVQWSTQGEIHNEDALFGVQCGGCRVTRDRDHWNESIAIVFFQKKPHNIPNAAMRHPGQVYVFYSVETPSKLSGRFLRENRIFDSMFNLTMNFRRDSDIVQYFGTRELSLRHSKRKKKSGALQKILDGKNKLAVWFVSNCLRIPGAIARMHYVMDMVKAGLKLDKFGECFRSHEHQNGGVADQSHDYKFYLAFENSIHCPSYVTEKFWRNSLDGIMVPVIFGPTKSDVEAVAPKNSYIHTDDFSSAAELVKYLDYLDSNHTAYLEYHMWRDESIDESLPEEDYEKYTAPAFCRLCRRQVLEYHKPKTIPSINEWFFETGYEDDKCLTPRYKVDEKEEMNKFLLSPNFYDSY